MIVLAIGPMPTLDSVSGLSVAFDMAVRGMRERGHEVFVVDTMPSSDKHVSGRFQLNRVRELIRVLRKCLALVKLADVVYAPVSTSTLGVLKDLLLGLVARFGEKPLVGHLHGGGERLFYESSAWPVQLVTRISRRNFSRIIVLGELLRAEYDYLDSAVELVVVPNGLPCEAEPECYRPKHWEQGSPVSLLYLSNMLPSKGYLRVLDACAILKARGVKFRCRFCGGFVNTVTEQANDNTLEHFKARVVELGLGGEVDYLGLVHGAQKRAELALADVFLLPTSYPWEGQPISIIEALSWGVPVVSTNHKGIPEQVRDGVDGILVQPPGEPHALADAVMEIVESPVAYRGFSEAARQAYEKRFTAKAFVENLEKALMF